MSAQMVQDTLVQTLTGTPLQPVIDLITGEPGTTPTIPPIPDVPENPLIGTGAAIDVENQCQNIDPALPSPCPTDPNDPGDGGDGGDGGSGGGTPDVPPIPDVPADAAALAASVQALVTGTIEEAKPEPSNPAAVVSYVGQKLAEVLDLLPVVGDMLAPAVPAVVDPVVAQLPPSIPTTPPALPEPIAAATSSAASEVASATSDPTTYATARACQVTQGRPPFCSAAGAGVLPATVASIAASPTSVVATATKAADPIVPTVKVVPSEVASQAPIVCEGSFIKKKFCQ